MTVPRTTPNNADIVRDWFASDTRADTDSGSWDDWNDALTSFDALVAESDEAVACLQRVVEADRDDSRMGHPNAGDSCIGICIALDVMPWLDRRGKLLPFVARATLAGEQP